jgi:hypothetical protein
MPHVAHGISGCKDQATPLKELRLAVTQVAKGVSAPHGGTIRLRPPVKRRFVHYCSPVRGSKGAAAALIEKSLLFDSRLPVARRLHSRAS